LNSGRLLWLRGGERTRRRRIRWRVDLSAGRSLARVREKDRPGCLSNPAA